MRRAWAAACFAAALGAGGPAHGAPREDLREDLREDRLCQVSAPAPVPAAHTVSGCAQAQCTTVTSDHSLCTCQARSGHRFEHRQGSRVLRSWATDVAPIMGAEAFDVSLADVDGDGLPEWLVVRQQGSSNGLGVSWQTLCVLWPGQPQRAPLCREVNEWQSLTVLVREPGRKACSLVDAVWQPGSHTGGKPGTYAVGRLQRLQGGRWQPAPVAQKPPLARRLTNAFMAERERLPALNAERLWYRHPQAFAVPCPGPLCLAPAR